MSKTAGTQVAAVAAAQKLALFVWHPPNTTRHCTWARPLLGVSPCRNDSKSPDDKHLWAIPSYRAESSPPYVG